MRSRMRWRQLYPDMVVLVGLPSEIGREQFLGRDKRVGLAAFVAGRGWQHGQVTLRRLCDIDGVEVIGSAGVSGGDICELTVVLEAPDGTVVSQGDITVYTPSPLGAAVAHFKLALGEPVSVPVGDYTVMSRHPPIRSEQDREFSVSGPTAQIRIPIRDVCRFVTIHATLPDGGAPSGAMVGIRSKWGSEYLALIGRSSGHWLPDGQVEISIRATSTQEWTEVLDISENVTDIRAELEWGS